MRLAIFLFVAICGIGACDKYKGASFGTGHYPDQYRHDYAIDSLKHLKKTGANTVMINALTRQWSLKATKAFPIIEDDDLRFVIRRCKKQGFKVFLKPVVEVYKNWRGNLPGTSTWFNGIYMPFIIRMATIAQEEGVDVFAVGSEYKKMEYKTKEWTKVIKAVKKIYKKGQITYVSNHDSYWTVKFWKQLDFIALSGYWVLSGEGPLDLTRTKEILGHRADALFKWRQQKGLSHMKVCFGEMGYQSRGEGLNWRAPYAWWSKAPVSMWQQNVMYEAFLSVFLTKSWVNGVIIWGWEPQPWAGKAWPSVAGYTPQNKPAQATMTKFFKRKY